MISLRRVSKHFEGKRKVVALDAVDLEIERGEMVSIVGPSGSGKSTLLNLIGGLDRASSGEIVIDGGAVGALSDDDLTRLRRDKIGFIFQFFNLLPSLTCVENVALPLHLKGLPRQEIDKRARELLGMVHLSERLTHLPDELSGGERQRVAIARALAFYPPVLLADEPDRQSGHTHRRRYSEADSRTASRVEGDDPDRDPRPRRRRELSAHRHAARRTDRRRCPPMILLRLISWPYIRKHLLRTVLTTAGIVLGVALLVGMQSANRSVLASFNQTVDRIAGKAQLQVSAGESGFVEEVLEKVQSLPEVQNAAPVIEAVVDTGLAGEGKLLILAVDMTGDSSLRDYDFENDDDAIDDPLTFLAQPDSLLITREFAARNGLNTGSKIAFGTMDGPKQFTVRGILKAGGMAAAFGGSLGIMDIYAAQKVFGRGRRFDRIDVGLREGVSLPQGQSALAKVLGDGFDVEPPSGRGRQFESLLGIYTLAMSVSSLFALFIGLFIIYNSFAIAGDAAPLRDRHSARAGVRPADRFARCSWARARSAE